VLLKRSCEPLRYSRPEKLRFTGFRGISQVFLRAASLLATWETSFHRFSRCSSNARASTAFSSLLAKKNPAF